MGGGERAVFSQSCGNVTVRYNGGERAVFSQSCGNVTVRYNGGGEEPSLASPVGMSR